jgi:hypothetical protein
MIKTGIYQHYKGPKYEVHGVARHSETEEWMVVYTPLYGAEENRHQWVRPYDMFLEQVEVNGNLTPRFALVEEK